MNRGVKHAMICEVTLTHFARVTGVSCHSTVTKGAIVVLEAFAAIMTGIYGAEGRLRT